MNSILTDRVALDTNEYILGLRHPEEFPDCHGLLESGILRLNLFVPVQVLREVHRNLSRRELNQFYRILRSARQLTLGFDLPANVAIGKMEHLGAKKGDAVIAAHLEQEGVRWLVSENRHFLSELPGLPFQIVNASQAIDHLNR